MTYKLMIPGKMPTLNDYLHGERMGTKSNGKCTTMGNSLKQKWQYEVIKIIRKSLKATKLQEPIRLSYKYYEPNEDRDLDNICSFAHKVIQDALVQTQSIEDDGWKNIKGFSDEFFIDKDNPRIEVTIVEVV